ncbi:hypothetical protein FRB94_005307 [Tulasnella sp. JGI-2019a]|nr:hypothetical protein FRB93_000502 [Tulasnella sp. JGI-2019a]KAG9000654.1 hypothetical protein FRB94_005307 [Tulasnella sp. JGI-2019a]
MAAVRPNYYAEEPEEDVNDGNLDIAIGNYGQNTYDTDQNQFPEAAAILQLQQQLAQQTALVQIPDVVKRFIIHFHQAVVTHNLQEISVSYESGWNRLTEKFYPKSEWPEAEIIAPLVDDDPIFLVLYRELYYRHVYSRLSPNVDDRFHSYENSCELFNYLLNSDGPVPLSLPDIWLWDIIDEFIYQFQAFCIWRSKVKSKNDEELTMLAEGGQIWSCYSVLNVLYSLIQKSKINEYLEATDAGKSVEEISEIVGEYGSRQLYRSLGYFSIIGLLRVHVLLGDYTLALRVMDRLELNQKAFFARVTACHVATYYYVGFCYLALRRYSDAVRTYASILNFISRMRQYHTKSYQYDQINKTGDRMYALLVMCHCLSPSRLDDTITTVIKERYGEQFSKMQQGAAGLAAFEELFLYACPKFISPNPPPYHDVDQLALYVSSPPVEPAQRHCALFLTDVRTLTSVPTLRSFLKLYKSLDTKRLAGLVEAGEEEGEEKTEEDKEEELVEQMMVLKLASRSLSRPEAAPGASSTSRTPGGHLGGTVVATSDLDFVIDENMVHVVESTVGRRFAGWFIRNTEHTQRVYDNIRSTPLPVAKPVAQTESAAPAPVVATPVIAATGPKPTVAWGGVSVRG